MSEYTGKKLDKCPCCGLKTDQIFVNCYYCLHRNQRFLVGTRYQCLLDNSYVMATDHVCDKFETIYEKRCEVTYDLVPKIHGKAFDFDNIEAGKEEIKMFKQTIEYIPTHFKDLNEAIKTAKQMWKIGSEFQFRTSYYLDGISVMGNTGVWDLNKSEWVTQHLHSVRNRAKKHKSSYRAWEEYMKIVKNPSTEEMKSNE